MPFFIFLTIRSEVASPSSNLRLTLKKKILMPTFYSRFDSFQIFMGWSKNRIGKKTEKQERKKQNLKKIEVSGCVLLKTLATDQLLKLSDIGNW